MSEHDASAAGSTRIQAPTGHDRRSFLTESAGLAMAGSLVASYGTLAAYAVRYLLPADPEAGMGWQYVAPVADLTEGKSLAYTSPSGESVVIARHTDEEGNEQIQALSSVCPHLGCRVHWEAANKRFFCPCHNGVFDQQGVAKEGPPSKAKQRLKSYETEVVHGLLFIKVRTSELLG